MKYRYIYVGITIVLFALMCAIVIALWRGTIPIEWLASFRYKGIFLLSLINGAAPVAGPSQIATFFVASKLNPLLVGLAAGIGGAIGELAGYAFGYSFRSAQSEDVERKIQRIANWRFLRISRERSFIPLFVLASIPNPFFDPISALAGSLRIRFARYFIPVLLGKTVRHLVIAFAGYYAITGDIASFLDNTLMIVYSILFVGIVLIVALVAWVVRSIFEDEPDPLILNFTFFAFAGQCILTVEVYHKVEVLILIAPAVLLLLLQVWVIRLQVNKTFDHYVKLLDNHKSDARSSHEIERWASVLVRITGVDFFPEFYQQYVKFGSPREKRRRQAILVLPPDLFNSGIDGVTEESLIIPPAERRWLWRSYAGICILSWILFIICIVIANRHQ